MFTFCTVSETITWMIAMIIIFKKRLNNTDINIYVWNLLQYIQYNCSDLQADRKSQQMYLLQLCIEETVHKEFFKENTDAVFI